MLKILKRVFQILLLLIVLLCAGLFLTGHDYIFNAIKLTYLKGHNTANIDDYEDFNYRIVLNGTPQPWEKDTSYNQIQLSDTLQTELEKFETAAFAVFKDGKLWYEEYWDDYGTKSKTNSFSMAKSVISMLMFAAIEDGYIQGINQPITDFLPEYKNNKFGKDCTIGDLSAMTSGYDWDEDYYLPLNPTTEAYYGKNLRDLILSRGFVQAPGGHFKYLSGNTQMLGIIIEKATGKKLSSYLSEKFWQPMGMEDNAFWSLDGSDDIEKTYCCLNSNARDFGKLGQLMLNQGNWNGKQLLDTLHVKQLTTPNEKAFNEGEQAIYGYSFWTDNQHQPAFYAMLGHLGQRIISIPKYNLVIVRLGHEKDQRTWRKGALPGTDIYYYVDEVVKLVDGMK